MLLSFIRNSADLKNWFFFIMITLKVIIFEVLKKQKTSTKYEFFLNFLDNKR